MRKTGKWDRQNPPKCHFHMSDMSVDASAGLFFYEGFGSGKFYHPDGTIWDCNTEQARRMARESGVDFVLRDRFDYTTPLAVGD